MYTLLSKQGVLAILNPLEILFLVITMTAGTIALLWLGELISEYGIGNGTSVIIFAGIVSGLPLSIGQTLATITSSGFFNTVFVALLSVGVIYCVVFINEATRNLNIMYAKRLRGGRVYGGGGNFLPLKVNMAGMIPIIFAVSLVLIPSLLAQVLQNSANAQIADLARSFGQGFAVGGFYYNFFYFILVFSFTYFYTAVAFNPDDVSDNLKKQGGFIPGIRPGKQTADYISGIVGRITAIGALFLGVVAVLPNVAQSLTGITTLTIGGAGILIVVSVVLETVKSLQSQLIMRDYEASII